jgi:hypothetical protein
MRTQGDVVTDESGAPVRMVGICEDVTDRAPAAQAGLRERALQINDEIVEPLSRVTAQLARGELEGAAAAIDATRRCASRLVDDLLGLTTPAAAQ